MDPSTFRRDPWLRTSGYHLATWSLVAFVLELRRAVGGEGEGGTSLLVALVGGAVLTSLTHERRVGKMAGAASEPVYGGTAVLWWTVLVVLIAGSAAVAVSWPERLFSLWTIAAGGGFFLWGRGARFAWYGMLGAAMVAVGLVDVVLVRAGVAIEPVRFVVLGLALPAMGLWTSYRYLWFRTSRRE